MPDTEISQNTPCPCGSGTIFGDCCQPVLAGDTPAATAEALMRSRYTAYVLGNEAWLLASWHASTRPEALHLENSAVAWQGLEVVDHRPGEPRATVEFIARYTRQGKHGEVHENSRFVKEQGQWFYVDGDVKSTARAGRNDPCPCGSGKKYKKCCGA